MLLYIDTATTSLWRWKLPASDYTQPYLLRIALCLTDAGDQVIERTCFVVRPPRGVPVEDEAIAIHHVTPALAATGLEPALALGTLNGFIRGAKRIISYNKQFHGRVLRRTYHETGIPEPPMWPEEWCAMTHAAPLVQSKLIGNGRWAWPKFVDAYQHFTGEPFTPHDDPIALGHQTVNGLRLIYQGIRDAEFQGRRGVVA